jgi:hypothetical protein
LPLSPLVCPAEARPSLSFVRSLAGLASIPDRKAPDSEARRWLGRIIAFFGLLSRQSEARGAPTLEWQEHFFGLPDT